MSEKSSFITLTIDDEHLPEDGSLDLRTWQLFAKKVRKEMGPFRYFHCGEYTEQWRPHYHACVFGHDWGDDRVHHTQSKGNPLYKSEQLQRLWGKGFVTIGEMNYTTAQYVAGYVIKKIKGKRAEEHYGGLKPEYASMSGGLGKSWFQKYWRDLYPADFVVVNGRENKMPKYYDRLLEQMDPEMMQKVKRARIERGKRWEEDRTPERLAVRERVAKAKQLLKERNL